MSFKQYRTTVTNVSLDNVGANDLRGLYAEFIKQLRNPGHGLGTALQALGVPEELAKSIEEIAKNPFSGTLVELNKDNRIGKKFGVDKETMDAKLKEIGDEGQSRIRYYGDVCEGLDWVADRLESIWPVPSETTTVRTR